MEPQSLRTHGRGGDLEARRRRQAAQIIQSIMTNAIHADDGSVAWVAPVLTPSGWSVRPLEQDIYNGISGLTLLFGAYLHETAGWARRCLSMNLIRLFAAALHTLHLAEAKRERLSNEGMKGQARSARRISWTWLADLDLSSAGALGVGWRRCLAARQQTGGADSCRSRSG